MTERSPEQEEALAKARARAVECTGCSWGRVGTFAYLQGAKHERATGHVILRMTTLLPGLFGLDRTPTATRLAGIRFGSQPLTFDAMQRAVAGRCP